VQDTAPLSAASASTGILDHAVGDFTVTVEAGTRCASLQENALEPRGQWLAIDWPWGSEAWLGGRLGRRPGGPRPGRWALPSLPPVCRDQTDRHADCEPWGRGRAGGKGGQGMLAGYDLMRLVSPAAGGSLGLITRTDPAHHPDAPQRRGLAAAGTARSPRWPAPLAAALRLHAGVDRTGGAGPLSLRAARVPKNALFSGSWQRQRRGGPCRPEHGDPGPGPRRWGPARPAASIPTLEACGGPWPSAQRRRPRVGCCRLGLLPSHASELLADRACAILPLGAGRRQGLGYAWAPPKPLARLPGGGAAAGSAAGTRLPDRAATTAVHACPLERCPLTRLI